MLLAWSRPQCEHAGRIKIVFLPLAMLTAVSEVSVDLQSSNLIGSVLVSTGKSMTDASIVAVSIVSQHSAICDSLNVKAEFQYD